ncbi:MAG: hypothetical protein KatS3mg121_1188 [Gammaproteobacteria bacterium]|nr:MAG: hypothetical protein KatS3mg121_1188 [Gammaproteobacteria bacterium]
MSRVRAVAFWLLLAGAAAACLAAGFWQLERAADKAALLAAREAARARPALDLRAAPLPAPAALPLRVRLAGRYRPERQFLLDNQLHAGRAGYRVLTPFERADGSLLLVDRGWLPAPAARAHLPVVAVDAAPREIEGWLERPARGFVLGRVDEPGWPCRVQALDMDVLAMRLDRSVYPGVLALAPDQPDGYLRRDRPAPPRLGPAHHRAYAVQWFALAATVLIAGAFAWRKLRNSG